MVRSIRIKDFLNSSLWITVVLIVRVGCIIEAHASTTVSTTVADTSKDSREDLSSLLVRQSGVKKKITGALPPSSSSSSRRLFTSRNLSGSRTSTTTTGGGGGTLINTVGQQQTEDSSSSETEDTCTSKPDGYFPNYGSDCTSYYFCAAGYQITFVCPPGARFSAERKKCENDIKCGGGSSSGGHKNICNHLPNGYYAKGVNSRKYFYCFNNAKVIELICDQGKVFRGNKCVLSSDADESGQDNRGGQASSSSGANRPHHHQNDPLDNSCEGKSNGFYPILDSRCTNYYFCIGGARTELTCQPGMVFNGDICVQESSYKCPESVALSGNSIAAAGSADDTVRGQTDIPEQGSLPSGAVIATGGPESTTTATSGVPVTTSTAASEHT